MFFNKLRGVFWGRGLLGGGSFNQEGEHEEVEEMVIVVTVMALFIDLLCGRDRV